MANKTYNKHAVLSYLFDMKTNCGTQHIGEDIDFTLREVGEGIRATGGATPTSWSNFVLDLTRKRNTIAQRLPAHVIQYGYDLRKKQVPSRVDRAVIIIAVHLFTADLMPTARPFPFRIGLNGEYLTVKSR